MSTIPSAKLLVLVSGKIACIKIAGRANFTSSIDFKALVNALVQRGYNCFVLELSDCVLMDSTFLGVLAGFGLKLSCPDPAHRNGHGIELLNPNGRITELLENLGVSHLFKVVSGSSDIGGSVPPDMPPGHVCATRDEMALNCLEAHRTLMDISPANASKFKDVAKFLADDLQKVKPSP